MLTKNNFILHKLLLLSFFHILPIIPIDPSRHIIIIIITLFGVYSDTLLWLSASLRDLKGGKKDSEPSNRPPFFFLLSKERVGRSIIWDRSCKSLKKSFTKIFVDQGSATSDTQMVHIFRHFIHWSHIGGCWTHMNFELKLENTKWSKNRKFAYKFRFVDLMI